MNRRLIVILPPVLLIVVVAGIVAWTLRPDRPAFPENELAEPWRYNAAPLRQGQADGRWQQVAAFAAVVPVPVSIAIGPAGEIAVGGKRELAVFTAAGELKYRKTLNGVATALAYGPAGRIHAGLGDHVERLDADGAVDQTWPAPADEARITGIRFSREHMYWADAGNRMVWRCTHDGEVVGSIGGRDPDRRQAAFVIPSPSFDLVALPDDTLYIVNPGRHRIERHLPDGVVSGVWGGPGADAEGFFGCCNPANIARLADGRFVTAEKGLARIKVHGEDGVLAAVVAAPADFRDETIVPDVAVTAEDRILVLDPGSEQVRVFARAAAE